MSKTLLEDEKRERRIASHVSDSVPVTPPPTGGTIERLIGEARNIVLICHVDPDGDAVGSLLGMGWALRKMGKARALVCADTIPERFCYLPGCEEITSRVPDDRSAGRGSTEASTVRASSEPQPNSSAESLAEVSRPSPDLMIALDCSDLTRMGNAYAPHRLSGIPVINIDHHVTNTNFGTVNWVDPRATATSEMVLGLIERLGVSLDATIATCLLNGIVTDTLGFRTPNTTPYALEAAVRLMNAGASLAEIADRAFNRRPLAIIRLWAEVVGSLQMRDRLIWSEVTRSMRQAHQIPERFDGGIVSFLLSAHEADAAVVFIEKDDGGVDVSMRSVPGVDVSRAAARLGGGGHPQAAGCAFNSDLDGVRARVLAEVERTLTDRTAT